MTPHRINNTHTSNLNRAARRGNHTNKQVRYNRPISRNSGIEQTVAVINTDDNIAVNEDLAFFRKKTEETPVTPEVPTKTTAPEESYNSNEYITTNPEATPSNAPSVDPTNKPIKKTLPRATTARTATLRATK